MRRWLFLSLVGLGACSAEPSPESRMCEIAQYVTAYGSDVCREHYGGPAMRNPIYYMSDYYCHIVSDGNEYRVIVGLDSTMDVARFYDGFYDRARTQLVAVTGNTTCDMIEQLDNVRSSNPTFIVYSTNGANDLSLGTPADVVVSTFSHLIDVTKQKWPAARIVVVGIHPSYAEYSMATKADVNRRVQEYLRRRSNACYVDPLVLFGVGENDRPPPFFMRDPIHYNRQMSFAIRDLIRSECGAEF